MGMWFFGGLFPKEGAVGAQRGAGGGPPGQRGAVGGFLSGHGAALEVLLSRDHPGAFGSASSSGTRGS